uniref:Uncharacterized protein n=1 Tax=Rhizophora mucronata TaxID=61149 RepID=A0A2P2PGL1_RHIMU
MSPKLRTLALGGKKRGRGCFPAPSVFATVGIFLPRLTLSYAPPRLGVPSSILCCHCLLFFFFFGAGYSTFVYSSPIPVFQVKITFSCESPKFSAERDGLCGGIRESGMGPFCHGQPAQLSSAWYL